MGNFITLLIVAIVTLSLIGCDDENIKARRQALDEKIVTTGVAESIKDYGTIEGCSIKWVSTLRHPNFWLVRCPNSTTTTEYDTGGKSPTRVGATTTN